MRDGEEAMEFLRREGKYARVPRPDLILLDMHLPKKEGREVLAEVRENDELRNIPVVVLTVSHVHQEILEGEGLQVEAYLLKPVDLARFVDVVKSLRRLLLAEVILPTAD